MDEYISRNELLKAVQSNVAEAHNERCGQLLEAILNAPTADVAPKSEVESLQAEVDRLIELVGTIPPDRVEFVSRTEINAIKENLAREIFEEIEKAHEDSFWINQTTNIGYFQQTKFERKLAELKKKYMEGKK